MNVFCLGPEQIDNLWPLFAHHLARVEEVDAEELRYDLKDAQAQLWGLQDDSGQITGVVVTRITNRACEIVAGAGSASYEAMRELHREIERWAASVGCSRMRLLGRKGWIRLLGYRQTGIVAEKEL